MLGGKSRHLDFCQFVHLLLLFILRVDIGTAKSQFLLTLGTKGSYTNRQVPLFFFEFICFLCELPCAHKYSESFDSSASKASCVQFSFFEGWKETIGGLQPYIDFALLPPNSDLVLFP